MGIWIRSPRLTESETVTWKQLANRSQSNKRAVGGCLHLTPSRLIFEPTHLDSLTGGRSWSTPLTTISTIGIEPRTGQVFNGGMRDRLRLDLTDGSVEFFVLNNLDEALPVLRDAVASTR